MPITTSVDQPPTSTTTSRPSMPPGSVAAAPTNASRASSSPLQHPHLHAGGLGHGGLELGAVRRVAHHRGAHEIDCRHAQIAREARLRGHHARPPPRSCRAGSRPSASSAFPRRVNTLSLAISRNEPGA